MENKPPVSPMLTVLAEHKAMERQVSERMLRMAERLRKLANEIEQGIVTGVAIAYVEHDPKAGRDHVGGFSVGTSHCSQFGGYTLGGGLLQLAYLLGKDLADAPDD